MTTVFDTLRDKRWAICSNGFNDEVTFSAVDGLHVGLPPLDGTYGGDRLRSVTYDEDKRMVRFERLLPTGELQTFEGFLLDHPPNLSVHINDVAIETHGWYYGLAGTFIGVPTENAARPVYGWFAASAGW